MAFWKSRCQPFGSNQASKRRGLKDRAFVDWQSTLLGEVIERETGFSKRELIVITDDYRPNLICFEFHNGKMKYLDDLLEKERVEVSFRIQGREWEGRVLNNLVCTRVVKISGQALDVPEL